MTIPVPTPPQKALKRVLIISRLDGWGLILVAVLSLLLTLFFDELLGIAVSLLVLAAGVIELRGRRALLRRDAEGMKLLVRSQLFLLTVILVYCARCLGSFDAGYIREQLIPEIRQWLLALLGISLDELIQQFGLTENELVPIGHQAFLILYGGVALISLIYQGGMALYYRSKIALVTEALSNPPPIA